MGRKMPYTNFHDLNLDWVIKQIKGVFTPDNPPPYPVKSVNGQTGNVNLTADDIRYSPTEMVSDAIRDKYTKPTGGIPGSDIAPGVIPDVSNFLEKPLIPGTLGQVLTSDGQGGQIWQNASAGTNIYTLNVPVNNNNTQADVEQTFNRYLSGNDPSLSNNPVTIGYVADYSEYYKQISVFISTTIIQVKILVKPGAPAGLLQLYIAESEVL